jgi:hypothetical protein
MKQSILLSLILLNSFFAFAQCKVTEKIDDFYGTKIKETNIIKIGKLGYVTEIKLVQFDTVYSIIVVFGDMSFCDVRKDDKIMFKNGSNILSLVSNKLFRCTLDFLPNTSTRVYKNYVNYFASKSDLQWLINNNVEKIRIEHRSGYKDLELKSTDGKKITNLVNCLTTN